MGCAENNTYSYLDGPCKNIDLSVLSGLQIDTNFESIQEFSSRFTSKTFQLKYLASIPLPRILIQYNLTMGNARSLSGVYAAVVTPLKPDLSPDLEGLIALIEFLAGRGCHGVLVMGTTGEGPSFSREERLLVYQAAADIQATLPNFHLLAGTGTPSLEETVFLTRAAFNLGYEGVVLLPPYYFRKATDEGIFTWFSHVMDTAVPSDGQVLAYHIPPVTGMDLSLDILSRIKDAHPDKFAGIKDSSGNPDWARSLGKRFGTELSVFTGNDRLFSLALQSSASGCITAVANLLSPFHRQIWDNFQTGVLDEITQDKLGSAREALDRYPPFPPLLKVILSRLHGFPFWKVKPPLIDFDPALIDIVLSEFLAALE
jgi:4-hydroxy-tetrahydrodipicolinate synthase